MEVTLMKRSLLLLGSVLSIAGAVGLAAFGDALIGIMDGVLTYRFVDPPEPLPASFVGVKWAAFSGTALTLGLVVSCIGTVLPGSRKTTSLAGRISASVAGILLVFGTIPLLWGVLGAKRALMVIAMSAATPKPSEVQEMVQATAPMLLIGSTILLVGSVISLVAGQVGLRGKPRQIDSTRSVLGVLVTVVSAVLGVVLSLLFAGIWLHGSALEEIFTGTSLTPKPSELAEHLAGVFNKSMLAFIGVACLGITSIFAAIFAPAAKSDAASSV
jgi:hypothetical protein